MKYGTKSLILKILIILIAVSWIFFFIAVFVTLPLLDRINVEHLLAFNLLLMGLFVVLLNVFGIKQNKNKPLKIKLNFNSYDDFFDSFSYRIKQIGYDNVSKIQRNNCTINVFRDEKLNSTRFYVVVKTKCLDDETSDAFDNWFDDYIKKETSQHNMIKNIYVSLVVCVDKVSSQFYSFVDSPNQNALLRFVFHSGISFGGNTVYISDNLEGFAITKAKKMQKEIVFLIESMNSDEAKNNSSNTGDGSL